MGVVVKDNSSKSKPKKVSTNFRVDYTILKEARWLCDEMDISLSLVVWQALRRFVYQKKLNITYYPDEYMSSVSNEESQQLESLASFDSFYRSL